MKKFIRLFCFVMAIVTAMSCFAACHTQDTPKGTEATTLADSDSTEGTTSNATADSTTQSTTDSTTAGQPASTTAPPAVDVVPEKAVWFDMISAEGKPCYIVYPKGASDRLISKVNKTSEKIAAITKAEAPVVIPETKLSNAEGSFIYVGNIDKPESRDMLSKLKYSDVGYAVYSQNILCVGGHSDDLAVDSLSNFWKYLDSVTIAKEKELEDGTKESGGRYFSSDNDNIKKATYKVESITVEGKSISEYSIVYAAPNAVLKEYAYSIQRAVGMLSGDVLKVREQSFKEEKNEILVGKTNRKASSAYYGGGKTIPGDKFMMEIADGKIVIAAPSDIMLELAVDHVVKNIFDIKTELNTIELSTADSCLGGTTAKNFDLCARDEGDIRILSTNMYFEDHTRERLEAYLSLIPVFNADVICLQEMDVNWHQLLDEELPKLGYIPVPTRGSGQYADVTHKENYTPIYYRADKYTIVDCGYVPFRSVTDTKTNIFERYPELAKLSASERKDLLNEYVKNGKEYWLIAHMSKTYSWVVLNSRKTGERFGVISAHMTHDNSSTVANIRRKYDAKEIAAKMTAIHEQYNIPVIALGDYNCSIGSDPYRQMLDAGHTDAMNSSEIREVRYTGHSLGEYPTGGGNPIDLAFHTEGLTPKKYQLVVNDYTVIYSDHLPLVFDFSINK